MKKNTFRALFFPFLALWILSGILSGLFDLSISKSLNNPQIVFVQYIEKYGEMPGLLMALWAFLLMNAALEVKNIVLRGLVYLANFFLAFLLVEYGLLLILYHSMEAKNFDFLKDIGPIFWVGPVFFLLVTMFVCKRYLHDFALRHKTFAKIIIWLGLTGFVVVQVLKNIWGRVRFRELTSDYSNFSPWYIPQQAGGESFPSGHTQFAWILLPLFLHCLDKNSWARFFLLLLSIVWGLTVGMSRIIIGAHYASDVLFSAGFSVLFFLILYRPYLLVE